MDRSRQRRKKTQRSLYHTRLETQVLQEELAEGITLVNRMQQERMRILAAIGQEIDLQQQLQQKIEKLKSEYQVLKNSLSTNQKLLQSAQSGRELLQVEIEHVLTSIVSKKSSTIKNDVRKLIKSLNSSNQPKERSVILNCLMSFIQTMNQNEFEEYQWAVKVAENENKVAARIRFSDILISQQDLRGIFTPVIDELRKKFQKSHLKLQVKTAKSNGVVRCMEITVVVFVHQSERAIDLA